LVGVTMIVDVGDGEDEETDMLPQLEKARRHDRKEKRRPTRHRHKKPGSMTSDPRSLAVYLRYPAYPSDKHVIIEASSCRQHASAFIGALIVSDESSGYRSKDQRRGNQHEERPAKVGNRRPAERVMQRRDPVGAPTKRLADQQQDENRDV